MKHSLKFLMLPALISLGAAAEENSPWTWGQSFLSVMSSDLKSPQDPEHAMNLSLRSATTLAHGAYRLNIPLSVQKSLTDSSEVSLGDSALVWSRQEFMLASGVGFSPYLMTLLPLSENSWNGESLRLSAGPILRFRFFLPNAQSILSRLSLTYQLSLVKNFHEFKSDTNGNPNLQYRVGNEVTLWAGLGAGWTVSVGGSLESHWSYGSTVFNGFELHEEISWGFNDRWELSAGHRNSGNVFRPDLQRSAVAFFDSEASRLYFALSYQYK